MRSLETVDQLSQRSDGRNSPTRSSRHLDAEAAAQAAQRLVDERRLSVDTEVDRLQMEKDKRARERLFEDRDLERRLNRLLQEQQNTDSLERARIQDQQEFDNELAAERANLTQDWVNSQAQLAASAPAATTAAGAQVSPGGNNNAPPPAAAQSHGLLQQHVPSPQQRSGLPQPSAGLPQQQSGSDNQQMLAVMQQMQQQMQQPI